MAQTTASADTPGDPLKDLQSQVAILQQQIQLATLQQTQAAVAQTAILTALKSQVSAQSDLDKASAQAGFAKLAGIKAGLDSVGAPTGKEGTITVGAGTAGALLLSLRKPMLEGIEAAATKIAASATGRLPIYVGTDAQVQSALQSSVAEKALIESIDALDSSTKVVNDKLGQSVTASFLPAIAAAGLALNTVVGIEKFFRVDTTYSVFDAGDDAQQTLLSMIQQKLGASDYRSLATVSIPVVLTQAKLAQESLLGLKTRYDAGAAAAASCDKLKPEDPKRPAQDLIDRLKSDLAEAKASLDALHPAVKPDGFWGYVQGLAARAAMTDGTGKYINRLVVSAKAQTIQIVEKRTWRSDKISGRADMQVDFRILDAAGKLLDSGLSLASFDAKNGPTTEPLYSFPHELNTEQTAKPQDNLRLTQ